MDESDFRVTFDENIMFRQDRLSLSEESSGEKILQDGMTLMEIKTSGGIPLWLTNCMTKNKIYKTSFSKYGTAYQRMFRSGKVSSGVEGKAIIKSDADDLMSVAM